MYNSDFQKTRTYHVLEDEVRQVVSILDDNIHRIANELEKETIREDWRATRQNYDRIDENNSIMYSSEVISAYSLGTTPIHIFALQHLFRTQLSDHIKEIENLNIVCLCGGSGAELVSLVSTLTNPHIHITVIDKESHWKSTYSFPSILFFHIDWIPLLSLFAIISQSPFLMSLKLWIYCSSLSFLLSRHDYLSIADDIRAAHLVTMGSFSFAFCYDASLRN